MVSSVEKLASGAATAMKDVKAVVRGVSGVFKHLMEEHGKVAALMMRVSASSDEAVRRELYPTIREELLGHEKGEVTVVYPALSEYPETSAIAAEHSREASELKAAIAEVDSLEYADVAWSSTFKRLVNLVEEHVAREESDYFPKAQETLGDERAKELLPEFEAAKRSA